MKPIKGHGLVNEGVGYPPGLDGLTIIRRAAFIAHDPTGVGVCACGAKSDPLPSDAARQRWHREHKQAVLDAQGGGA